MLLMLEKGQQHLAQADSSRKLVEILYERNDIDFQRGTFRVRGDVIEVFPTYDDNAYRIELWGDEIENLSQIDPLLGQVKQTYQRLPIYPKTHYVMSAETKESAMDSIRNELEWWHEELEKQGKLIEAQRLHQRTMFDLEMMKEIGYCHGIENYSRHFSGRLPGEAPPTLLDYLPNDAVMFLDESHQTVPQLHGMYHGDRSRKEVLVAHGFRLPSALDNRPLTFEEFEHRVNQLVYVSATPGPYELTKTAGVVVEQIIRPTGLLDPTVEIRPVKGQVDDLLGQIRSRVENNQRVLVTTLTKRMAEDLAEYYSEVGVRCRYLHSEVSTLDRIRILRDLRRGEYDVLIGINLLREGLDLPEVSLVAILDADKEGFLRSSGALIQTIGRAARHVEGHAILYADVMTDSMRKALAETDRRRADATGIQRAQRHHAAIHHQAHRYEPGGGGRGRLRHGAAGSGRRGGQPDARTAPALHRRTRRAHARSRPQVRVRKGGAIARSREGAQGAGVERASRLPCRYWYSSKNVGTGADVAT